MNRLIFILTAWAIIAGYGALTGIMISHAPRGARLEAVTIALPAGSITLNAGDLGQLGSNDLSRSTRLIFSHGAGDSWSVAGGSPARPVRLSLSNGLVQDLATVPLRPGDRISLPPHWIALTEQTEDGFRLVDDEARFIDWRDGADFGQQPALDRCAVTESGNMVMRAKRAVRHRLKPLADWLRHGADPTPLFSIGGGVNCPERWQAAGLAPDQLRVLRQGNHVLVRLNGNPPEAKLHRADGEIIDLAQPSRPLDIGIAAISIGRVRYAVELRPGELRLLPGHGRALWTDPTEMPQDRPGLRFAFSQGWAGGGIGLDALLADEPRLPWYLGGGLVLGLALATLFCGGLTGLPRAVIAGCGAMVAGGAIGFVALDHGLDLLLALELVGAVWLWASLMLAIRAAFQPVAAMLWLAVLVLAGAGLLAQLRLAIGMPSDLLIDVPRKLALCLSALGWIAGLAAALSIPGWRVIGAAMLGAGQPRHMLALLAKLGGRLFPVFVLGALAIQAVLDSETGLGAFQPSEFGKTLWALVLAYQGAWFISRAWINSSAQSWPRLIRRHIAVAALLCLPIPLGLKWVDHNGPLPILAVSTLVLLGSIYFALRAGMRGERPVSGWLRAPGWAMVVLILGLGGITTWFATEPAAAARFFGPKMVERLAEQQTPCAELAGVQNCLATESAASAPFWPDLDALFSGKFNDYRVRIMPEIENDMVVTFILRDFGRAGLWVICAGQLAIIIAALTLGCRLLRRTLGFEGQIFNLFLGLLLMQLAAILAMQWLMGYMNALNGVIIGQPFVFFSAGNSSLVALIGLLLVAMQAGDAAPATGSRPMPQRLDQQRKGGRGLAPARVI